MIDDDVKQEFRKLDQRLGRVEQFLPTLATKRDLRQERQELHAVIATLATKEDLKAYPTTATVQALIQDEGERTRRYFDVVAESLRDEIRLGFAGHIAITSRVDTRERTVDRLDRRVMTLETSAPVKRRK